jgi:hypothetical protein
VNILKKEWQKPTLTVLDINMTMLGSQDGGVDFVVYDPFDNEKAVLHS